MAGSLSDYAEKSILDHLLRNTAFAQPAGLFVGLFTVAPSDAGGGTEVVGNNYSRVNASFSPASSGPGSTQNSSDIVFPIPSGSWGTVVAFGVYDAITGGNLLFFGGLSIAKTISQSDILKFLTGNLQITLD